MPFELVAYNVFMVLCFCFTAFQLGRAYEITQQMEENKQRHVDEMIRVYRQRG
jgi:hypothetical protein